jgi:hypothetical protein
MENTTKQKGLDPDADTCFLDQRTEERNNHPIPNLKWNDNATNQLLPSEAQPKFLTGQAIDAKNTLQSFHTQPSDVARSAPDMNSLRNPIATDTINQSDPTIPSGEIIDSKNTLQFFQSNNSTNTRSKTNNFATNMVQPSDQNVASEDPLTFQSGEVDAQAENVYVAQLVADNPRRKAIFLSMLGILAVLSAIVIAGLCFSGKCGSKDNNGKNVSTDTRTPTFPPTASLIASPVGIDVVVEGVVSAFLNNISYFGQEIFMNGTNAESRALKWILKDDPLFVNNRSALLNLNSLNDNEVNFRVRQRFSLVTLWFQQMNDEGVFVRTWENTTGWLTERECEWFGIACDTNRSVIEISFYNIDSEVNNEYIGSIPPDIGLLTSLRYFSMRSNKVTGTIPEPIGHCSNMRIFDVANGLLSGTIPSSLGKWSNLYYFGVSVNAIVGSLPTSTTSWTEMTHFSVSQNRLSGSIPSFIGLWRSIEVLDFIVNMLTNSIPEEVGNLGNLTLFGMSNNRLTGSLPSSIGKMTSTRYFWVNDNLLTGAIPSSIGNWSLIEQAFFEMNDFTGELPPEICPSVQVGDLLSCDCQVNCSCCTKSCTP